MSQAMKLMSDTATLARPLHNSLPQMLRGDLEGIAWNNAEDGHVFCTGTHDGIRPLRQASVKNIVEEVQGL